MIMQWDLRLPWRKHAHRAAARPGLSELLSVGATGMCLETSMWEHRLCLWHTICRGWMIVRHACFIACTARLGMVAEARCYIQTRKTEMQKDLEQRTAKRRAKRLKRKVLPNMFGSSCIFCESHFVFRARCSRQALGLSCTVSAPAWLMTPICMCGMVRLREVASSGI